MLLQLLVVLVVCGIAWYFLGPYVAEPFKTIVTVIVVLAVCLWLLSLVGFVPFHLHAQEPPAQPTTTQTQPVPQSPVIEVPGTPPTVNPEKPSQPAVAVQEVKSPAAPSHYTDQIMWGVMVSFALKFALKHLANKSWFPWLTPETTSRVKTQIGFVSALLTAAGIHFAVSGSVLDGGGAAITISGISFDALKDVGWQWAAQEVAYRKVVKGD